MPFTVENEVKRKFEVACPADTVFEVLSDVPESASHFPKTTLHDMGDGKYRWEFDKIGVGKYSLQTIYACKYVSDEDKGTVKWTPVKGEGNAQVRGQWTIKELKDGNTRITLNTKAVLEIPLAKLLKPALAPIVIREFDGLIDKYIDNLVETFED